MLNDVILILKLYDPSSILCHSILLVLLSPSNMVLKKFEPRSPTYVTSFMNVPLAKYIYAVSMNETGIKLMLFLLPGTVAELVKSHKTGTG